MGQGSCERCGSGVLVSGYICLRCPICGETYYGPVEEKRLMWSEHRLGLMFGRGGWLWTYVMEPPSWFYEEVA